MTDYPTTKWIVKVGGKDLVPEAASALDALTVDQHVGMPTSCTLRFHDPEQQVMTKAALKLGATCSVTVVSGGTTTQLFTGEITGLEVQRRETGATFTLLRAFDVLHRLQRGRETLTYVDSTYADIASKVITRNRCKKGTVQSAGGTHEHVTQVEESDWQFLRRLAGEIGFVLDARDGKVHFAKPAEPGTDVVLASLDDNVLRLDVAVVADEAVSKVTVRGWTLDKKTVASTVTAARASGGIKPPRDAQSLGTKTVVHGSTHYATQAMVKTAADAIAANLGDVRGEVNALLRGNALLHPGGTLELKGFDDPYDGRYTISQARHEYRPDEGYEVDVVAGSGRDRTLLGTLSPPDDRARGRGRHHGVVPGLVTSVKDPQKLGRVKVAFPWLDEQMETSWARVMHPGAGAGGRGIVWMPEINDEVLVAFADGDIDRAYVLGGVYNTRDKFDAVGRFDPAQGAVDRRSFRTRKGHAIELVDGQGKESISVKSGDGRFSLVYDATHGKLSISCDGMGGVEIASKGPLNLQGQQVKIESKTTMDLSATGPMTVKGAIIKLN